MGEFLHEGTKFTFLICEQIYKNDNFDANLLKNLAHISFTLRLVYIAAYF